MVCACPNVLWNANWRILVYIVVKMLTVIVTRSKTCHNGRTGSQTRQVERLSNNVAYFATATPHACTTSASCIHIARYWSWWCAAPKTQTRLHQRTYTCPGPNLSWHVDGYDKLKPFGLSVHGCIDGFSRRLLWLQVQRSNKNPRVIANCFLEYVNATLGCPVLPLTNIEALKRALLQRCNVIFGGKLLRWIFWDKSSPVSIQSMKSENRILLVFISKDAF